LKPFLFPNVYVRTVRNSTQTLKQSATECGPPNITSGDKKQKKKKKRMSLKHVALITNENNAFFSSMKMSIGLIKNFASMRNSQNGMAELILKTCYGSQLRF